jgi:hypothetical protein
MTREDLAALEKLEDDVFLIGRQFPTIAAGVRWLCALVKRLDTPESVADDRDQVLQAQSARIAALEARLGLTPERVLAVERAEMSLRDEVKVLDRLEPEVVTEQSEGDSSLELHPVPELRRIEEIPTRLPSSDP